MTTKPLPDYSRPPVVETFLGVQFDSIAKLQPPLFGLFWSRVRADYPTTQLQPAIASQIEKYENLPVQQAVQFNEIDFTEILSRYWLISKDGHGLLQLQNNRFLWNWRQGDTAAEYPRYDAVIKPTFNQEWERFLIFLDSEKIERPAILQCEIAYVNHIEIGDGWDSTRFRIALH